MAGVHGISCTFVRGAGVSLTQRPEVWATPGMDGVGAQRVGKHDGPFLFEAVLYGTSSAVDAWFAAIEARQATIGSIVDDWNTTHTNCLIIQVGARRKQAAMLPGDTLECIGTVELMGRKTV